MNVHKLEDLNNVIECTICQTLQGEYTGTIRGIYDDLKSICGRDQIIIDGQTFIVMIPKKSGGDCKTYFEAELWHISYSLIDYDQAGIEEYGKTYQNIIDMILTNSGFSCSSAGNTLCDFKYSPSGGIGNKREALMQFVNERDLDIKFNNMSFEIGAELSTQTDYTFTYRKDIKHIDVTEDMSKQITRIIPVNSDGVTIAEVNDNKIYLDSDNIASYPHPICYTLVVKAETDDPTKVLEMKNFIKSEGQKYLTKYKYGCISFDIDVLNYSATYEGGNSPLLSYGLGGMAKVNYAPLGVSIDLRISEFEYDALRKRNVTIKLDNVIYRGRVGEYESLFKVLAGNIVGKVPMDTALIEDIAEDVAKDVAKDVVDNIDIEKIAEDIINTDIVNSQIVNAQEINTNVLNAEEIYADYAVIGDAEIKRLMVDELKTIGSDGYKAETNNFIYAHRQFIQWITGNHNGEKQATSYAGKNLYYVDDTKTEFTLASKKPTMRAGTNADMKYILEFIAAHEGIEGQFWWVTYGSNNYLVHGTNVRDRSVDGGIIITGSIFFNGSLDILLPSGVKKTVTTSPLNLGEGDYTLTGVAFTDLTNAMQNTFTEHIKAEFAFYPSGSVMIPCIRLGEGTGNGDKGKAFIWKKQDGLHVDYHATNSSKIYSMIIDDSGIHLKQDDGTGAITDIPLGSVVIKSVAMTTAQLSITEEDTTVTNWSISRDADTGKITALTSGTKTITIG